MSSSIYSDIYEDKNIYEGTPIPIEYDHNISLRICYKNHTTKWGNWTRIKDIDEESNYWIGTIQLYLPDEENEDYHYINVYIVHRGIFEESKTIYIHQMLTQY